ncbi:hypothetical protein E1281_25705 [Actinomadura sp. KC345]|nr:hypothetical protein E1281_25705 [Actinomadura sp. KC345]
MVAHAHLAFLTTSPPPGTRHHGGHHSGAANDGPATQEPGRHGQSHPDDAAGHKLGDLVPLTVNEIRRMHGHLRQPRHPAEHRLRWSQWRRRHQAHARRCHYQRQQRLTDH